MKTSLFLFCAVISLSFNLKTQGQTVDEELMKAQALYKEGKPEEATKFTSD